MPVSWAVLSVILAVTSVALARAVYRLATHVLTLTRDLGDLRASHTTLQRRTEMESREFTAQISSLRERHDEMRRVPDDADHHDDHDVIAMQRARDGIDRFTVEQRIRREERKRATSKPQDPAPTSFERILKDDPEDPV
jgi:hypothetical protein